MVNGWFKAVFAVILVASSGLSGGGLLAQTLPTDLGNFSATFDNLKLANYDGKSFAFAAYAEQDLTLVMMLAHDCPICQQYAGKLKELSEKSPQMKVIGVAPSDGETKETIGTFAGKYGFNFPILLDPDNVLAHVLKAKVTPEAFLFDKTGNLLYRGKIDNWFYELGKSRQVVTEHYLDDAISQALAGQPISINKTEPIGCMLNMGMHHH